MRLARQAARLARCGIAMVSLGLAACQSGPHMYVPQASALVNGTIEIGMKRNKVLELLGPPQRIEKYGMTEFFFYNPPWTLAIGAIGRLPIAITDGKVVALGKGYYDNFVMSQGKSSE